MYDKIKNGTPIEFRAKVQSGKRRFPQAMSEPYEHPSFVLIGYDTGINVPLPLFLPFKEMKKHTRKMDIDTIKSWLIIKMADRGRGRAHAQQYLSEHRAWEECHGQ